MLMLIDMHHLMHRAYWVFKNLALEDGTPTGMIYGSINIILSLVNKNKPKDIIVCYDGGSNRRKQIYADYKADRIKLHNGFYQQMLITKQILHDLGIKQTQIIGEEADDVIGSLAVQLQEQDKIIIVSGDHDFLQLINDNIMVLREGSNGKLYTKEMIIEEYGIEPSKLVDVFSLTGDSSDNIKGVLAGVGIKRATKYINQYGSVEALLEKSESDEKLQLIKEHKDDIIMIKNLVKLKTDLQVEISQGDKNLELVKTLFEQYLKFKSFLAKWREIENLSNLGGDDCNKLLSFKSKA